MQGITAPRSPILGPKVSKHNHRSAAKRTSIHSHPPSPHDNHAMGDGRHKRVWKACERCRMKKTKAIIRYTPACQLCRG